MLNQLLHENLAQTVLQAQNSPAWTRAKKLLGVMLGLWLAYFLLVVGGAGWQHSAVVGLDDDDIGFADIDVYQPRAANG